MGESRSPRTSRPGHAQTLAIMVIVLPALIGAMGLATDVGNYYFNYVKVQTAADASVLSGAKYLTDQPCSAILTANIYATCVNGIAAGEVISTTTSYGSKCPAPVSTPVPFACATPAAPLGCATPVPPPSAEPGCNLTINVQRTVPYYFARLVGVTSGSMNVSATATTGPPVSSINSGTEPIAVQYSTVYSDGASVTLLFRQSSLPNSWWGIMLGGSPFTTNMPEGYEAKVSINDAVAPDRSLLPGMTSAAIQTIITAGRSSDSSGTHLTYTANDLRAATVALVDWGAAGGCCRIKGFAKIWIESVSNGNISGIADGVNGVPDTTGTVANEGALAIGLTQ
jgi:Flp pilus assembly protein TadG